MIATFRLESLTILFYSKYKSFFSKNYHYNSFWSFLYCNWCIVICQTEKVHGHCKGKEPACSWVQARNPVYTHCACKSNRRGQTESSWGDCWRKAKERQTTARHWSQPVLVQQQGSIGKEVQEAILLGLPLLQAVFSQKEKSMAFISDMTRH